MDSDGTSEINLMSAAGLSQTVRSKNKTPPQDLRWISTVAPEISARALPLTTGYLPQDLHKQYGRQNAAVGE